MFLRGRTMFGPCLGDANTHAPHMCQFPYKIKSKYSQQKKQKCTLHPVSEHIRFTPAYPVSATPTAFALRIGQFPPYAQSPSTTNRQNKRYAFHPVSALAKATPAHLFLAGVRTMRARICSAFSCDMFARVVWLRLRRARDYRISLCYLPHALATHGLRE